MRKPSFCIYENKGVDQLRDNRPADQRLGFRYLDSTFSLLPKSGKSSLLPSSVAVQPSLCRTKNRVSRDGAHIKTTIGANGNSSIYFLCKMVK